MTKSTADNGEAVSNLLEDVRCNVDPTMLDMALRKDYAAMAEVLQQDEGVRSVIRVCATCSVNIGAYECFKGLLQCQLIVDPEQDALPVDIKVPKYCRAFVNILQVWRDFHNFPEAIQSCGNYGVMVCSRNACVLRKCLGCDAAECEAYRHSMFSSVCPSYYSYSDDSDYYRIRLWIRL